MECNLCVVSTYVTIYTAASTVDVSIFVTSKFINAAKLAIYFTYIWLDTNHNIILSILIVIIYLTYSRFSPIN
jgi:hypothetical protein